MQTPDDLTGYQTGNYMARSEILLIYVSKRKHIGSFYLKIKNNFELPTEQVSLLTKNGLIDKNGAYEIEKVLKKIIDTSKEKQKTKALNWKILFNQESYIEQSYGSKERICKIEEDEIDIIFEALRIMS